MRFTKMHGIGNDYVYVDCFSQPMPANPAEFARRVSDRHTGIGSDGLILICPSEKAHARMRMFNADGSESEMCGNGIRCVAKYVYDHQLARERTLRIETGAGVLALDLEVVNDRVRRVRVNMGHPTLEAAQIPVVFAGLAADSRVIEVPVASLLPLGPVEPWTKSAGLDPRVTCVSMGNPHAVLYCEDTSAVPLEIVGPKIEHSPHFPNRINVHFVQVHSPREVTMRTWERGSGITLACGTGACAVCVAGALTARSERKIVAHLPGGDLELEWSIDGPVYMTGPAEEVFSGDWTD